MSEHKEDRTALARGGIIGFVGATLSAVLGFLLSVLLARLLGSAGSGVVTQATGVFSLIMAMAKLGFDSAAIYLMPRLRIGSPEEIRSCLTYMGTLTVGISLGVVLVLEIVAPRIWGADDPSVLNAVRAIMWFIPVGSLTVVAAAALRALGNMREYVLVQNITLPVLRPVLVAVAVALGGSLTAVSVSWALPFVVVLLLSWFLLLRHLPPEAETGPQPRWPGARRRRAIMGFALPRTLSATLEQGLTWLDVLIVGALAGNAAAGIYGGASRYIQAGLIVDTALRIVVSPQFSRLMHTNKMDELRALYSTATIWLVLFATMIHLLMAIFAPCLMLILGPEFLPGSWVLVILCCGAIVTFCAGNIHSLLIMSGRSGWAAFNKAVVLVTNIIGNLVLIPVLGINGAALSWAVCMVVDAALATIQVVHFLDVRPNVVDVLRPLAGVGVSVGIPAGLVALVLGRDSFLGMGIGVVAALVCFAVMCRLLREPLHLSGLGSMLKSKTRNS
ncbi:Polysaccharide biosynthesis C-terminal domain [Propionibacterium ruminifibrarum]|uniref:Polysaccharide biosynthesis C-terminal domain n=1 Tax=Propionibacterium ruminifibrarum TaxID=1962131 RepID=A0A375HZY5_9ACTN|nr:oligosaccharide flippase family protein [Propionibacterium ruminifibrarum]SPF68072.1 Polysaccharide biosynthesis C-terminal domain [Propionibacterium ruminifibrarum]